MHGGSRLISDLQSKLENRIGPKQPLSRDEGAFKERYHENVREETQKRVEREARVGRYKAPLQERRLSPRRRMAQEKDQGQALAQAQMEAKARPTLRDLAQELAQELDKYRKSCLEAAPSQVKTTIEEANSSDSEEAIAHVPDPPLPLDQSTKRIEDQLDHSLQQRTVDRSPPEIEMFAVPEETQESLKATDDLGRRHALFSPLLELWSATTDYFLSSPLSPGKERLKWQCACGHTSYDDFVELRSGALAEMQTLLEARGNCALTRDERPSGERLSQWRVSSLLSLFGSIWTFCASLVSSRHAGRSSAELPQHLNKNGQSAETVRGAEASMSSSLHVLLSFPYYSHGSRLYQPPIKNMRTDREFFKLLRVSYNTTRSRFKRLVSLKTIKSVKFVQLERFRSDLVDIRKVDDLPPPADKEYVYYPKPPDLVPPVGENLMLHLFLHPDHADDFSAVLLKRIPKKNNLLSTCPVKGSGLGWGIHFGGGWHYGLLWFCLLLLTVLGSLVFLVCWAVLEHDVQGASGVAGYVLVLITAAGGSLQAAIEMEIL